MDTDCLGTRQATCQQAMFGILAGCGSPLFGVEIDGVVCPVGNPAQTLGTGHTSLEGLGLRLFSLGFRKRGFNRQPSSG